MKKITSIWDMVLSQAIQIEGNTRVFQVCQIQGKRIANDEIGVYYENALIGYISARNKATFVIEFLKYGMMFKTIVKYNSVTGFGDTTPTGIINQETAERIVKKLTPC